MLFLLSAWSALPLHQDTLKSIKAQLKRHLLCEKSLDCAIQYTLSSLRILKALCILLSSFVLKLLMSYFIFSFIKVGSVKAGMIESSFLPSQVSTLPMGKSIYIS